MKFSSEFIDKVRESNDLVDLVGSFTHLKSSNSSQFQGRCPFPNHNDKSPSFSVSRPMQFYHCFGCNKSGNIFNFVKDHQGLSFLEAVEFLARRAVLNCLKMNLVKEKTQIINNRKDKKSNFMKYRI